MDAIQLLEILKAGETGIGVNTVILMYLTWLTKQLIKRIDAHDVRITALEIKKEPKPVTA